jgi:hypothetical protein
MFAVGNLFTALAVAFVRADDPNARRRSMAGD